MRSRALETYQVAGYMSNNNGMAPCPGGCVTWTNVGSGSYDIRLCVPGAKLLDVMPHPSPGAELARQNMYYAELPPRLSLQFLTPAGGAGAYGGYFTVMYKRGLD